MSVHRRIYVYFLIFLCLSKDYLMFQVSCERDVESSLLSTLANAASASIGGSGSSHVSSLASAASNAVANLPPPGQPPSADDNGLQLLNLVNPCGKHLERISSSSSSPCVILSLSPSRSSGVPNVNPLSSSSDLTYVCVLSLGLGIFSEKCSSWRQEDSSLFHPPPSEIVVSNQNHHLLLLLLIKSWSWKTPRIELKSRENGWFFILPHNSSSSYSRGLSLFISLHTWSESCFHILSFFQFSLYPSFRDDQLWENESLYKSANHNYDQ